MDNNKNFRTNGLNGKDGLEEAYNESMRQLGLLDGGAEQSVPSDTDQYSKNIEDSRIYDEMLAEIERRRSLNKSIWTDEPVIPIRKSVWLDDDNSWEEVASSETEEEAAPEQTKRKSEKTPCKKTVEITISPPQIKAPTESEKESAKKAAEKAEFKNYNLEFSFINAALCLIVFFGVGISLIVMNRESGFIQSENRNLAKKPELSVSSYLNGEYARGITKYYTDTIPGREDLKKFASAFSDCFGLHINDVKIKGDVSAVKKETLDEEKKASTTTVTAFTGTFSTEQTQNPPETSESVTTTSESVTTTKPPKETVKKTTTTKKPQLDDGEWAGNVVISGSGKNVRAMSAFYGMFENGEKYAAAVNKYKKALGDKVNVYNMSIPLSSAFYMPDNLKDSFSDQKDCIDNIGMNLSGIIDCNVFSALEKHTDEYIYSRTDHHWQPRGAYYAAQVFAKQAGVDFPKLSEYEKCKIEGFVGTMYAYSDYDEELKKNPDSFIYYKPDNKYTVKYYDTAFKNPVEGGLFFDYASGVNCYSAILNRDEEIVEITTDCKNGRTLVIMKDSYGNALVPFLTHGFSKIYVCDFRYMDINAVSFMKKVKATDVLFSISLSACYTPSHVDAINADRTR